MNNNGPVFLFYIWVSSNLFPIILQIFLQIKAIQILNPDFSVSYKLLSFNNDDSFCSIVSRIALKYEFINL